MIREILLITIRGFLIVAIIAAACFIPYVIGAALIEIAEESDRRGPGARWLMGCFALFLTGASYFIGKQLWSF